MSGLAGIGVNAGVDRRVLPVINRTGAGVGLEFIQGFDQIREMPGALAVQHDLFFGRCSQLGVIE